MRSPKPVVPIAMAIKSLVLDRHALKGSRIGVARNYCGFHEGVDQLMLKAIGELRSCGAEVIDDLELTPMSDIRPAENVLMATEFKVGTQPLFVKAEAGWRDPNTARCHRL